MDIKHWAFFFVFILSSEYVFAVAGEVVRKKRAARCRPDPRLVVVIDQCLERARVKIDHSYQLGDSTVQDVQLGGGTATGFRSFRRTKPITCSCMRGGVRIFINISFLDVTVTWLITLLDGLLGGILGNLGTTLVRVLGNVVNLVVKLVALEINLEIAVDQRFLPGSTCRVTSYKVTRVSEVSVLGIDLTQLLVGLLGEVLTPVFDTLVRNLLERQIRVIITTEIEKVTISRDMTNCDGGMY